MNRCDGIYFCSCRVKIHSVSICVYIDNPHESLIDNYYSTYASFGGIHYWHIGNLSDINIAKDNV